MSSNDPITAKLDEIVIQLNDIQRSVCRLRHARFTGLMLFLLLGCGLGAGTVVGTFYLDYRAAKRAEAFLQRFRNAGLNVEYFVKRDGSREVAVSSDAGSFVGGTRTSDTAGVVLKFREAPK